MHDADRHLHRTPEKLYRYRDLVRIIGVSRITIWRWIRDGKFPEPDLILERAVKWFESTIIAWQNGRWKKNNKKK